MDEGIKIAIEALAAAIIKAHPEMKSSDKAFQMCLFDFRVAYFDQRARAAAIKPSEPEVGE